VEKDAVPKNIKTLRNLGAAFKVIAEELESKEYLQRSLTIFKAVAHAGEEIGSSTFKRESKLDIAKLYHLESLMF
jgi:hypothetical protein